MEHGVTEVRFYHLQRQPLDTALPKLLEKVLEAGLKAVVKVPDGDVLETLDTALWTYDPASFLPHGSARSGHERDQPVFLTTGDDNPADASVLVLVDAVAAPDIDRYDRCLYMFDGRDDAVVTRARAYWSDLKDRGVAMSYWQQRPSGGWEQKA